MHSFGKRVLRPLLIAPVHELLDREAAAQKNASIELKASDWTDSFHDHPKRLVENDDRDVFPCALYLDGARYTRATLIGEQDSTIAFTAYNLCTQKRHLLTVLAKRNMC
eukprot:1673537-Pyramimonas_sp.AAC.1